MAISIGKADSRYRALDQGHNLRWPATPGEASASLEFCESTEDVVRVLQEIVDAGRRPTLRSGGHCYEDFAVSNPGGSIIDLSLLPSPSQPQNGARYQISAGARLGDIYSDLFKRANVTIPGGSCSTVGAGGHMSGGGYGLLSRMHGLTVDWLSAVDIVTINEKGKAELRRADKNLNADLYQSVPGSRRW